jgi:autotransporter-associated beta strand protein
MSIGFRLPTNRGLGLGLAFIAALAAASNADAYEPYGSRWGTTASGNFGATFGRPAVLTWSIVPDGTTMPDYPDSNPVGSTLIQRMDQQFGAGVGGSDLTQRPWFSRFSQPYARIAQVSGLTFIYEPNDDGASFPYSSGLLGTRGDLRIGGKPIATSTIAYNYPPSWGEMVLSTSRLSTGGDSGLRDAGPFRSTFYHETLHGLGFGHVHQNSQNTLMGPSATSTYDLQFDEILGLHHVYGDFHEKSNGYQGNETATHATTLGAGTLNVGGTLSIGTAAPDGSGWVPLNGTVTDFVSISGSGDIDFFKFTLSGPAGLSGILNPKGPTYNTGPDGGSLASFNSKAQNDLTLTLYATDGTTVLGTYNSAGLGGAESFQEMFLKSPGDYYARVTGSSNATQMYRLDVSAAAHPYFWDNNGSGNGFGTASGTWAAETLGNSSQGWVQDHEGTTVPGNATTSAAVPVHFGGASNGLAAGTINVSGTVESGNMTFGAASGHIRLAGGTINMPAAATIKVDNAINTIQSAIAGAGTSLTKSGNGTLVLSGANTYTGTTTISAGTLQLGDGTTDGQLQSAVIANHATLAFNTTGTQTFAGSIIGSGGLTKTGHGTQILAGTNTYTGPTTISAGTLQLGDGTTDGQLQNTAIANQATLAFHTTGTQTFAGAVSGTGTIQKDGAGTLTLVATASVAATQTIALNDGTVVVMSSPGGRTLANDIVLDGGTMAGGVQTGVGIGGTVSVSGDYVTHTFTTSGTLTLPVAVSTSQLIVGGGGGGGGGVQNVAYVYGGGGGQVLNLTGQNLAAGDTLVTVGAGGSGAGNADGGDGGSSSVESNTALGGQGAKVANARGGTSGSGNLGGVRNGSAAGGGGGNAAAGSNAPNNSTGGAGGAGTANTAITGLTGTYGGGGGGRAFTTGGAGGIGGGGAGGTPGTANTGGGGGGGQSGGSGIVVVQYAYDPETLAGALTLSGTIDVRSASTLDASRSDGLVIVSGTMTTTTGSGGLAIASSTSAGGVVRYDAANTYLGNTTVQAGATLRQGIANALPSGTGKGNLIVSSGGTFDLNGFNSNINGLSGSGVVRATSGPATLTLGNGDVDGLDFAGTLQDGGGVLSLVKVGNGTQILSGNNTYTGLTTVSAGTLLVNGSISGPFTVASGATLGGTGTINGNLTLGGDSLFWISDLDSPLTMGGNSTLSFTGDGGGFGIDRLANIDWETILEGTYTLVSGDVDFTNIRNVGLSNAHLLDSGYSAYFQEGSLQLVVTPVPEPSTIVILAAGAGFLGLRATRRRRAG